MDKYNIMQYTTIRYDTILCNQLFNQSVKIYVAPLQDTYSEALPTQAKRKSIDVKQFFTSFFIVFIKNAVFERFFVVLNVFYFLLATFLIPLNLLKSC